MLLYPSVLVEGSFSYARLARQSVRDLFIPEGTVQLQGTWDRWSPFVGLGAGVAFRVPDGGTNGRTEAAFAPSFSMGTRIAVTDGAGIRVEGRLHGIGADFGGVVAQLTSGLSISW